MRTLFLIMMKMKSDNGKMELRRAMKARRKGLAADAKAAADAAICEKPNARCDVGGLAGAAGGSAMDV